MIDQGRYLLKIKHESHINIWNKFYPFVESLNNILNKNDNSYTSLLEEYFSGLIKNEYCYFSNDKYGIIFLIDQNRNVSISQKNDKILSMSNKILSDPIDYIKNSLSNEYFNKSLFYMCDHNWGCIHTICIPK